MDSLKGHVLEEACARCSSKLMGERCKHLAASDRIARRGPNVLAGNSTVLIGSQPWALHSQLAAMRYVLQQLAVCAVYNSRSILRLQQQQYPQQQRPQQQQATEGELEPELTEEDLEEAWAVVIIEAAMLLVVVCLCCFCCLTHRAVNAGLIGSKRRGSKPAQRRAAPQ